MFNKIALGAVTAGGILTAEAGMAQHGAQSSLPAFISPSAARAGKSTEKVSMNDVVPVAFDRSGARAGAFGVASTRQNPFGVHSVRQPTAIHCNLFKKEGNHTKTDEYESETEPTSSSRKPMRSDSFLDKIGDNLREMGEHYNRFLQENNLVPQGNYTQAKKGITFDDVAGLKQEKWELVEIVDFLKNPDKYTRLGAKLPKGVLLEGPPGTGKTLLAKAVASEANVPFNEAKGSDFVEMFVGLGAQRVRKMFKEAAKKAPCIIFIDEFDAVGGKRSGGEPGRNEERDQTLNALLAEMDGFENDRGIIVMATTNRRDILDSAVIRPGRFDRIVNVGLPDWSGREEILKVHSKNKPLAKDVDLKQIAERTLGFSGAELANLLNEAAILSARDDLKEIPMEKVQQAYEKVAIGLEKPDRHMDDQHKRLVAFHEAGHALVAAKLKDFDDILKVSIVPRGPAGGLTWFQPDASKTESGLYSKEYLKHQLAVALGGRAAEELVFGEGGVTTGASNDLKQVSNISKLMVLVYGMSALPPRNRETASELSEEETKEVDKIVMEADALAKKILNENRGALNRIADELMKEKTLDAKDFHSILDKPDHHNFSPSQYYLNSLAHSLHPDFRHHT